MDGSNSRKRIWGLTSRFTYTSVGTRISSLTISDEWLKIGRLIGEDIELRRTGGLVRFRDFRLPVKWYTDVTFINNGVPERVHFRIRRSGKLVKELQDRHWQTEVVATVTLLSLTKQLLRRRFKKPL